MTTTAFFYGNHEHRFFKVSCVKAPTTYKAQDKYSNCQSSSQTKIVSFPEMCIQNNRTIYCYWLSFEITNITVSS